jgi:hypothetical protein
MKEQPTTNAFRIAASLATILVVAPVAVAVVIGLGASRVPNTMRWRRAVRN